MESASTNDLLFEYDEREQEKIKEIAPWKKDPKYFKRVKLSAMALLKMVMHAHKGGGFEIMGLLLGKIEKETIVVSDVFATPAEGSEARVNMGNRDFEFIGSYLEYNQKLGIKVNCVGWYHSHPSYGAWLSGIDIKTQMQNQLVMGSWLAIVVDPIRTVSSGEVDIGAFRTFPEGYKDTSTGGTAEEKYQSIPSDKISDYGVHHKRYYKLPIKLFQSSQDEKQLALLWNKYWIQTLSSSSIMVNWDFTTRQIKDLAYKLKGVNNEISKKYAFYSHRSMMEHEKGDKKSSEKKKSLLSMANCDSVKFTTEALKGLLSLELKRSLFNLCL